MATASTIQAKVDKYLVNLDRLDRIINGPPTGPNSEVELDTAISKTLLRILLELGAPASVEEWNPTEDYPEGTWVTFNGITYYAKRDVPAGTPLNDATYWQNLGTIQTLGGLSTSAYAIAQNARNLIDEANEDLAEYQQQTADLIEDINASIATTNQNVVSLAASTEATANDLLNQIDQVSDDLAASDLELAAEVASRSVLAAQLRGAYTGTDLTQLSQGLLYQERTARAGADAVNASEITGVKARMDNAEAGLSAQGTAVTSLTSRITAAEGTLTSQSGLINVLQNTISQGATQFAPNYLYEFEAGLEGFEATNGNLAASNGLLTFYSNAADPILSKITDYSGRENDKVRLRLRRTVAGVGWNGYFFWSTSAHGHNSSYVTFFQESAVTTEWSIIELDLAGFPDYVNNTITSIRFDFYNYGGTIEIDWIAIGKRAPGVTSTAIAALNSAVSSAAGSIASQSGQITSLSNRMTSAEGVNTSQATAISSLTSGVTSLQGAVTSQSGQITSLQNEVVLDASNLLINADWTEDMTGWVPGWDGNGGTLINRGRNGPDANWYGVRNTYFGSASGAPAAGTVFDTIQIATGIDNLKKFGVPVENGERLFLSAYIGQHRTANTQVCIVVWDGDGQYLYEAGVSIAYFNADKNGFKGNPVWYERSGGFHTINHVNARYVTMFIRTVCSGESVPYCLITGPMIAKASAHQIAWPPFVPGKIDVTRASASALTVLESRVTVNEAGITSMGSSVTSLTARIQTRTNLIKNSNFANGFSGWTFANANFAFSNNVWGPSIVATGGFTLTFAVGFTDVISVQPNEYYVPSADILQLNPSTAYVDLLFYTAELDYIGESAQNTVTGPYDFDAIDVRRNSFAHQVQMPANCYYVRFRVVWDGLGSGQPIGVRRTKLERGTLPATAYSDDGDLVPIYGGINTNSSAISSLNSSVSSLNGTVTSQAGSITSLNGSVSSLSGSVSTQGGAISALTTRMSSAEGSLSSQSGLITSLSNRMDGVEGVNSSQASAISSLNSQVSFIDGTVSAQAGQISSLSASVGGNSASITSISAVQVTQTGSITSLQAQHSNLIDVNGKITGTTSSLTGNVSRYDVLADIFSVSSYGSGARTEFSGGNWRTYDASGVLRVRMGVW